MSFRKQQIESLLKRAISTVLTQQVSDPRIVGLITVTRVDVSPDLHDAYVYISVVPEGYQSRTLAGLRHAVGYIHGLVCKAVTLKTVPHLDFRIDDSIKREATILAAIRRGVTREKDRPPQDPQSDGDASNLKPSAEDQAP